MTLISGLKTHSFKRNLGRKEIAYLNPIIAIWPINPPRLYDEY